VALVGRSGAGKTSIANLIPRFYDPLEGAIRVDGRDLRQVTVASLRNQIALVLQDTFLFNDTVRENIRYGSLTATDEEVHQAALAAHAHEFIMEDLPEGYDTEIGERGVKLSGGQKQRLAIARALLADPRILILDEATSSVDTEAERIIQAAINQLVRGRTTFVIAHRLSTIVNADQILVLEDGSIVERGTHAELMALDGLYKEMYDRQFDIPEIEASLPADAGPGPARGPSFPGEEYSGG
jgi:subfamily B ATP-binding cassette protein MsbA